MKSFPPRLELNAKDDDQIAFENGSSCEHACRYQPALDWFAEVKPSGGRWDIAACIGRVAILVAMGRAREAVMIGMAAINRMQGTDAVLIAEVARAWNVLKGSASALELCRYWLRGRDAGYSASLWSSAAAYASRCGMFARSLRYLVQCFSMNGGRYDGDFFLDMDFAPLWQHLRTQPLSSAEVESLRWPKWYQSIDSLAANECDLPYESIPDVPAQFRSMLCLHTTSMDWQPRAGTHPELVSAFTSWCREVRAAHRQGLECGLRKALASEMMVGAQ